jgi:hypothetical protein
MAYIEYLAEEETPEVLKEMYRLHRHPSGKVSNIVHIQAPHPDLLMAHNEFFRILMIGPSPLSRAQREMIGVVSSAVNECPY